MKIEILLLYLLHQAQSLNFSQHQSDSELSPIF